MFLFILKLISTVRKAIAGRRYPSQLAWGLALGVLLGLIPHGNLLTVALVLVILTLQVNHAMVALVGIGLTFVAPKLDPQFHAVGQWFFEQPRVAEAMIKAWQLPLMPWTDLNNTVVMGSFLIGLAAVLPIVMLTYPVFRRWSLSLESVLTLDDDLQLEQPEELSGSTVTETTRVDQPHSTLKPARGATRSVSTKNDSAETLLGSESAIKQASVTNDAPIVATSGRVYDVRRIDPREPVSPPAPNSPAPTSPARATRVAIVVDPKHGEARSIETVQLKPTQNQVAAVNSTVDDQQKIDEALSYLLRQLRSSKDKDAA
ncbi:TIGR03546 family protein [Neorhodopirellula pilleata]|uniref:DUF2062 domain-containing protein n=1 Tax=Neorhodopirellula pilleata TaxID=2714738 RepID=A0A5C6A8H5_9BACT|nr:TIGR03546 family protein [Neorhodopirellula pilleata]TWT95697.1 hypothetical protein Pla100_33390 [Neorhodopirellula pilleata]